MNWGVSDCIEPWLHQYCEPQRGGATLTGLIPPGGLVLAQLQLGSLHFEASQEYPNASGLVVGPSIPPSWASASSGVNDRRATGKMAVVRRIVVVSRLE